MNIIKVYAKSPRKHSVSSLYLFKCNSLMTIKASKLKTSPNVVERDNTAT